MLDSVHSSRWLAEFQERNIDFLLFPSSPHRKIHPGIKALISSNRQRASYSLVPFANMALPFWLLDKLCRNEIRACWLKRKVKTFNPSHVHAQELQNAGYICLSAFRKYKPRSVNLLVTNWGSDIFWFQKFRKHKKRLGALLAIADSYSAECSRDLKLAEDLGFTGQSMPVVPNSGGFSSADLKMQIQPISKRGSIAVKGYHGWAGRAKVALRAIEELSKELRGLEINVFSANRPVISLCKKISKNTGLKINAYPKKSLERYEVLEIMSRSRIYIGVSRTDGISTSMLEAMAMGAIPVQTTTSCCKEWFSETGVAVGEISVDALKGDIIRALDLAKDQNNVDHNRKIVESRASSRAISDVLHQYYS